jgi:steroid delta-isomerase-like uncharacterized protein
MGKGETLIRTWFGEIWNKGRIELYPELMQPDGVFHTVGMEGEPLVGLEGFRKLYDPVRAAFSEIKFSIEDVVESGDTAAARWTCTMKHVGDQLGVAPSGKTVSFTGMAFVRLKDGKVAESWDEWNRLGFMKQAGIPLAR